jgi:hypothetical protein
MPVKAEKITAIKPYKLDQGKQYLKSDSVNLDTSKPQIVRSRDDKWNGQLYDGAELRPYTGRAGAMDFKKCPSGGFLK